MLWKDAPPFHGVILRADGSLLHLEPRATIEEVLVDLKPYKYHGLDFIHNANGASTLPSKVAPPPPPRKQK